MSDDVKPHPQLRRRMTYVVAGSHFAVAALLLADRARYGSRPPGEIGAVADHPMWAIVHIAIGGLLAAAVWATHLPPGVAWQTSGLLRRLLDYDLPPKAGLHQRIIPKLRWATYRALLVMRSRGVWFMLCGSFGTMGMWGALMLWWAVSLEPDATWAVGVLAAILATGALFLADREE